MARGRRIKGASLIDRRDIRSAQTTWAALATVGKAPRVCVDGREATAQSSIRSCGQCASLLSGFAAPSAIVLLLSSSSWSSLSPARVATWLAPLDTGAPFASHLGPMAVCCTGCYRRLQVLRRQSGGLCAPSTRHPKDAACGRQGERALIGPDPTSARDQAAG